MFYSNGQDGNIDRAAYITLKVDGFPFDEVYEVMMYIRTIVSSVQAHMLVFSHMSRMLWQMVDLSLATCTGLAHNGGECWHGENGAARASRLLSHKILPGRSAHHLHVLRLHVAASVSDSPPQCLLPKICHLVPAFKNRL